MEKTVFGFTVVERADFPEDAVAFVTPAAQAAMRKAMAERMDLMIRATITPLPPEPPTNFTWPPKRNGYRFMDPTTWTIPA